MTIMRQVTPILAALKKHKAGAILIGLQIALTLAVTSNAVSIIESRIARMDRPTGLIENDLLAIRNDRVGADPKALRQLIDADLMTLRRLPGVESVAETNSFPLGGGSWPEGIRLDPAAQDRLARSELFFVDQYALDAMGAKLIAGRNFREEDIVTTDMDNINWPAQAIITKALADKVYPDGSALGKPFYIGNNSPSPTTVIGIVDHLQASWSRADSYEYMDHATLLPMRLTRSDTTYLIRTKPGQLDDVSRSGPDALVALDRMRVFQGVDSYQSIREEVYESDRGMATLMGAISVVLLMVTAAGIFGLTSFWVGQRRKQIGVRRALGATQADILSYFLTENLLIAIGGVVLGTVLAIGLNLWLMSAFELMRLSPIHIGAGVLTLLVLGQIAVLGPALRASRVSPVESIRSV
jgi:putative ABC transport system permease protein